MNVIEHAQRVRNLQASAARLMAEINDAKDHVKELERQLKEVDEKISELISKKPRVEPKRTKFK